MPGLRNSYNRWKCGSPRAVANPQAVGKTSNKGVALVVTLLLLFLMSVLVLAAVIATSSDLMINGYYGNSRASFYAADAGLNMARQAMEAKLNTLATQSSTWNTSWSSAPCGSISSTVLTSNASNFPLTSTAASSAISAISQYANTTYVSGPKATAPGAAANSWGESFSISNTGSTNPYPIQLGSLTVTCVGGTTFPGQFQYVYNYTLTSVGTAAGLGSATVTENGSIIVNVIAPPGVIPVNYSFSGFGAYIGSFPPCFGALVTGTLAGPVFADSVTGCTGSATHCGEWDFSAGGSYIFTDPVNQTGPKFTSGSGSGCPSSATVPFTANGTKVNPTFEAGFNLNQPTIPVPANDFSQRWAVLDGLGCGASEGGGACGAVPPTLPPVPNAEQMYQYHLQNLAQNNAANNSYATVSGSTYTAATAGVFMPYTCSGSTCSLTNNTPTITVTGGPSNNQTGTAGGIWVEGSQSGLTTTVTLSTTTGSGGSSNPSGEVITIAQTKSGATTTTTITIDPVANTTTVKTVPATGSTTNLTLVGVPQNVLGSALPSSLSAEAPPTFPGTSTPAATEIYVDGNVSITGPSSGAAIQNNTMVSVTANGNITQTGNLLYATEPVTTSANQVVSGSNPACCNGDPVDTLIPLYQNMNQVLGLYTSVGQFQLKAPSSSANMETDATIAAITASPTGCTNGAGCSNGDIATVGSYSVKTWTNVGGRSESAINTVSISTGNVYYDQRFKTRSNFAPPFFPQTTILEQDITGASTTAPVVNITQQRVQWVNQTGGQ